MWVQEADDGPYEPVDRVTEPERWLTNVYSDRVIVTQFDDGLTPWPKAGDRPTCSASMPTVVAAMLRALEVQPGQAVLEIGTGTGFNAALLSTLVGPQGKVTTVEVDATLAGSASVALATYSNVDVVCADAASDDAVHGEWDRVMATAAVRLGGVPYPWVEQARPGGIIVAPMRTDLASGPLVRFEVNADGVAIGHAVPWMTVGFMELRAQRTQSAGLSELRWDDDTADRTYTDLAPWVPLLADDHRWPLAVALPSCRYEVLKKTPDRPGVAWLVDPVSDSWASVVQDGERYLVRQQGPRRLWDAAASAYSWWQTKGSPPIEAWEWTVTRDRQTITLP
jgi:protein-L-isoaspartate O-methyltransferase